MGDSQRQKRLHSLGLLLILLFIVIRTAFGFWFNVPSVGAAGPCDSAAPAGLLNFGQPDGRYLSLNPGSCFDVTLTVPITSDNNEAYDFVFYERLASEEMIELDWVELQLSKDRQQWQTVFYWG